MFPVHDDNPTRHFPLITVTLIGSCVLVFIWQISTTMNEQMMMYGLGVTPAFLFGEQAQPAQYALIPVWLTLFSSMFLHGDWLHLLGNMLYLWIFGNNVEDHLGRGRFVLFYLVCGCIAVFAHALPAPDSTLPMIGASGAISGVLGAYLVLYPQARVLIVIPVFFFFYSFWSPAWLILAFWFVFQILNSVVLAEAGGGGVAWGAHIGGFIAGMVLIFLLARKRRTR